MGDTLAAPAVSDLDVKTVNQADRRARNEAAIKLLKSWCNPDEEERANQRETWDYLKRVLDEDRLSSYRKLFPQE